MAIIMQSLQKIGIIAGEASGDILGADLIRALRKRYPDALIEGIGGKEMIATGCHSLYPMETLSVMGLTEVLKQLPAILRVRRGIIAHFLQNPPDVFIGIDSPDFNLPIEMKLRQAGVFTVHYNSPTVWAWRQKRVHKIARSTHLMLTLFPFEAAFYQSYPIQTHFVGHPLAERLAAPIAKVTARQQLNLPSGKKLIALLPGSRSNELKYLTEPFLKAAQWCLQRQPGIEWVVPFVNAERKAQFLALKEAIAPELQIHYVDGQSREAMAAADVVLLASGTATLECLLLKRPMVVAYRLSPVTYAIAKHLVKTRYISLPNILADKSLVPEFIQAEASPENLGKALLEQLANDDHSTLIKEFDKIHLQLQRNASEQAADAIVQLMGQRVSKPTKLLR